MLREGVEIMTQAWSIGEATFAGEHYRVDGAQVRPQPLQEGGIPVWIAGAGAKVTLKIAAQYASYTNFAGSVEEFSRSRAQLAEHCAAIGRDPGEIVQSSNFNAIVGETEAEAEERLAAVVARLRPHVGDERAAAIEEEYRASDGFGTPEQIAERLARRAEAGLGYAILYFPEHAYDRSGVDLFERTVVPALT